MLDELDRGEGPGSGSQRQYVRWPFRHLCVPLKIFHAGGSHSTIGVACRNISCGGLSVLHNSYVHSGRPCQVTLPRQGGRTQDLDGTIKRCRHLTGIIHEVGIQFKEAIRISDFGSMASDSDVFSMERIDPASLKGSILCVGGSDFDRKLIKHHAKTTCLRCHEALTAKNALDRAAAGVDLILIDETFEPGMHPSLSARIREQGIVTPILGIVSDAKSESAREGPHVQADAFIGKPISQTELFQAIAGLTSLADGRGLVASSLTPDHPSFGLVESFSQDTGSLADALDIAMKAHSVEGCVAICRQLASVGPLVGFGELARIAKAVEASLQSSRKTESSDAPLRRLIACCRRIKAASR